MSDECDCSTAQDQIYQYLDAELDDRTAAAVRSHLDECGGCLDSYDFERRLKVVVRQSLSEDMPETLVVKVRELIRQETAGG